MRNLAGFLLAWLTAGPVAAAGAVAECAACHRAIVESYRRTGMGRSFRRMERVAPEFTYDHAASEEHFRMYRRDGRFYQRRHQTGPGGFEMNVLEMPVDYVLGSGNHAQTFLHLDADGRLVELPVAWYSERGGVAAMNPGYEGADHMDFRRRIDRECFFCHNAYPAEDGEGRELRLGRAIPEGIDCERCHGPARAHIEKARSGAAVAAVRAAIVNPRRLAPDRQIEVCLQCHLESTSLKLPYAIRRYGRGFFSYRPGEPLADYILHFDRATPDDRFEINSAGYRLLQSKCFQKSAGALTCITCHNPHQESNAADATGGYLRACAGCHAEAHHRGENCIDCHMPKRRTDDVVHAVMTDHAIVRRQSQGTPSTRSTEVIALYPKRSPELYLALAQVIDGTNLADGIPRLRAAIQKEHPVEAEFYLELGAACSRAGDARSALSWYEEALRRKPSLAGVRVGYAQALIAAGRTVDAIAVLTPAPDPPALNALGAAYLNAAQPRQAVEALRRALRGDPDLTEAWVNLGNALVQLDNAAGAIDALQQAIRLRPGSTAAHSNLASILDAQGDFARARDHFERAIRIDPTDPVSHYNFGRALTTHKLYPEAEAHLRAALRLNPAMAEAAVALGMALERSGRPEEAMAAYREALTIRPELGTAHFNLGLALLRRGETSAAKQHFEAVIRNAPNDFEARLHLGKILLDEKQYDSAIINLQAASQSSQPEVRSVAHKLLQAALSARQN
jgi:tetratricopeptide (TPR) repeat protein